MSKSKGNRTRKKCQEYYEDKGYIVDVVEKTSRYAKIKDLFGLFDLLAIKGSQLLFIQVKTNRPPKQEPYVKWARQHCNYNNIKCICWTWYDNKGARIQEYLPNGQIDEIDERCQ